MNKTISITILLLCSITFGQDNSKRTNGITLGYFNDRFGSHGMRAGYENVFYEKHRPKHENSNGSHSLLGKLNLSFFRHPRADWGFLLNATIGYRFTNKYGAMLEPMHLGIGGMYSILDGKTYQVDINGNVTNKISGYWTFVAPYIQLFGMGYDFRRKLNLPFHFSISLDAYSQRNINSKAWLRLSTPISFTYYIK